MNRYDKNTKLNKTKSFSITIENFITIFIIFSPFKNIKYIRKEICFKCIRTSINT